MIIHNKEEAEKYIEDRRFEIFLERLQLEREPDRSWRDKSSAEIALSNLYSDMTKMEVGFFDERALDIKEKTILELIEEYPMGIQINKRGGMCPLIKSTDEINHITKGN
tara:strand:- start:86254 stop:86580 length:327 start_codon:yes stop_codon:yes gene_type:complete